VASYSPVYSAQFIVSTPTVPASDFEVPAGFTAIVRFWSVSQEITDWLFQLKIQNSSIAPACIVVNENQIGINTYISGDVRVVVPGGGFITYYLSSVGEVPFVYVGGYLLRNVAA
jgi:hypothetical protein